jgi:hypothetical protein
MGINQLRHATLSTDRLANGRGSGRAAGSASSAHARPRQAELPAATAAQLVGVRRRIFQLQLVG